jgi:hypothetical protein
MVASLRQGCRKSTGEPCIFPEFLEFKNCSTQKPLENLQLQRGRSSTVDPWVPDVPGFRKEIRINQRKPASYLRILRAAFWIVLDRDTGIPFNRKTDKSIQK